MTQLLSPAEVADMLKVSRSQVRTLARQGRLPYYRLGDSDRSPMRFNLEDVERYISRHKARPRLAQVRADSAIREARRTA